MRTCAGCGVLFDPHPARPDHRYHDAACENRAVQRRHYERHRERILDRQRLRRRQAARRAELIVTIFEKLPEEHKPAFVAKLLARSAKDWRFRTVIQRAAVSSIIAKFSTLVSEWGGMV